MFEAFDSKTGAYKVKPATKPLTVRHLLTHTSGLGYNWTSPIVRDFKPRDGEKYTAGPLLFEPGEQWMYRDEHRLGRPPGRAVFRQGARRVLPAAHLRSAGHGGYVLQRPASRRSRLVPVHRRQADGKFAPDSVEPPVTVPRPIGGGGLASTAADYTKFLQMLLNGGMLNGARVLRAETVELMGRNQIGNVSVPALKTAMPERSSDSRSSPTEKTKGGSASSSASTDNPGKRSPGSLSWGGINNTYFWIDPTRGIAGVILMQFLPFADEKALGVYDAFERAVTGRPANSPVSEIRMARQLIPSGSPYEPAWASRAQFAWARSSRSQERRHLDRMDIRSRRVIRLVRPDAASKSSRTPWSGPALHSTRLFGRAPC